MKHDRKSYNFLSDLKFDTVGEIEQEVLKFSRKIGVGSKALEIVHRVFYHDVGRVLLAMEYRSKHLLIAN